jgi:acyl-CoA hydrolase
VKPSLYVAVIDKCRTDRQGMSEQIVDQRELTMSVLMTPDMANFSGNVRGGVLLKLLDQVAFKQPIHERRGHHTNSCYFTMVAYDSKREGHTTPSPFTCHA